MLERERIRHDLAVRRLTVSAVTTLTPTMVRISLTGDELAGFSAPGPHDHVKVFFPDPATRTLTAPTVTSEGVQRPTDGLVISRDYTPRALRTDETGAAVLDLDFVLHGEGAGGGPASAWAATAKPGDPIAVAGPRGSRLAPEGARRVVLIADETALPAFCRWLGVLPEDVPVTAIVEVADDESDGYLGGAERRRASIEWLYRIDGPGQLDEAVRSLEFDDDTYVWAAGEAGSLVAVRRYLRHEAGITPDRLTVEGYWRRGVTNLDHHAPIDPSDPD